MRCTYLDGYDVRTIDPQILRENIGLVNQEPSLFGISIAENIAYGRPNTSRDRVIEVNYLLLIYHLFSLLLVVAIVLII